MQTVVVPGAGVTTVVRCGGLGSLLLTDTQPASHIGTSRRTAIFGMALTRCMASGPLKNLATPMSNADSQSIASGAPRTTSPGTRSACRLRATPHDIRIRNRPHSDRVAPCHG
ncbi:hypothetical protein GA566_18000 [Cupriavidus sp. SW-Y-13]|nr:hypothetical protein [Cupriavidus sp. SW-Y-13]